MNSLITQKKNILNTIKILIRISVPIIILIFLVVVSIIESTRSKRDLIIKNYRRPKMLFNLSIIKKTIN